jgi:hypothetical protein
MNNLNRLEAVLTDAGQTNKLLEEQLDKDPVTLLFLRSAQTLLYRTCRPFQGLQACSM